MAAYRFMQAIIVLVYVYLMILKSDHPVYMSATPENVSLFLTATGSAILKEATGGQTSVDASYLTQPTIPSDELFIGMSIEKVIEKCTNEAHSCSQPTSKTCKPGEWCETS